MTDSPAAKVAARPLLADPRAEISHAVPPLAWGDAAILHCHWRPLAAMG
jgi:hypothetical protein